VVDIATTLELLVEIAILAASLENDGLKLSS
jgi:hypothetical protein